MSDRVCFVIDPDVDGNCHGKYERSEDNIPEDWEDIVIVDKSELGGYDVIDWRYGGH